MPSPSISLTHPGVENGQLTGVGMRSTVMPCWDDPVEEAVPSWGATAVDTPHLDDAVCQRRLIDQMSDPCPLLGCTCFGQVAVLCNHRQTATIHFDSSN